MTARSSTRRSLAAIGSERIVSRSTGCGTRASGCHSRRDAGRGVRIDRDHQPPSTAELRRRPTIGESTRPIGLYPSLHSERSEATRGSAAARPLIWRRLVRRRRKSSRPFLHDRLWKCVGGPSRGKRDGFARKDGERPRKWQRSEPIALAKSRH